MPDPDQRPAGVSRPEWELLLACVRARFGAGSSGRIGELLKARLNWDVLVSLAVRHRVMPILHEQMEYLADDVPRDLWRMLHDLFLQNTARNLTLVEEVIRVVSGFTGAGVPVIAFRGPVMSARLYGSYAARQFADLDFLVRREDAARATRLLQEAGYEAQFRLDDRQEQAYLHFRTERFFIRPAERACADLHWRILPRCLAFEPDEGKLWERVSESALEAVTMTSLDAEDIFLFLCAHGTKHAWAQLSHVCDVAAWVRAYPTADWQALLERARKAGKKRIVLTALGLAREVLSVPLPGEIEREVLGARGVRTLIAEATAGWARDPQERAPKVEEWSFVLRSLERVRDKAGYLAYLAAVPSGLEIEKVSLPRALFPVYYLIRAARLLRKRAAAALQGAGA